MKAEEAQEGGGIRIELGVVAMEVAVSSCTLK